MAGGGGGAVGPVLLLLSVEQLLELAQAMGVKLDLEARRFHPVFAQYAPSIAEYAAEEWGGLFVAEQLVPSLRAHCEAACADGATESKVAALGPFLPLWRQMHRMNARWGRCGAWRSSRGARASRRWWRHGSSTSSAESSRR